MTDTRFHVSLEVEAPFLGVAVTRHVPHMLGCDFLQGIGDVPGRLPVGAGFGVHVAASLYDFSLRPRSSARFRTSW